MEATQITFPITAMVDGKPKFLGTGFFIDHLGGFVTAKHVLDQDDIDSDSSFVILQIIDNNHFQPRKVRHIFNHPQADICLGKPDVLMVDNVELENKIWEYDFNKPKINEKIKTLAYPNSVLSHPEKNVWKFIPERFEGNIVELYDRCPTCLISTECYQTDMEILSGSSGGPVFNELGKVIGVNSMSHNLKAHEIPIGFVTPLHFLLEIEVQSEGEVLSFGELMNREQLLGELE